MKELDYTQLTLYQEDSPASPSPKQENTKEPTMTVTSGLKCLESYEKSGPLGSLVKMCLGSSVWHSTRCNLIWKKKVTKSNLSLFQLAVSMPRTKEKDASFWPTICANGMGSTGHQQMLSLLVKHGIMTEEERRGMICGNGGIINPEWAEWLMGYEQQFTKLIPTPTATDYKGGCLSRYWKPRSQFVHVERERERRGYDGLLRSLVEVTPRGKIGPMNPEWVEWLMGYPIGWTELNASETQ